MTSLEHMVRSFARRIRQNGELALVTDGQPALIAAFQELGWSDPYPDPELLPKPSRKAKASIDVTDLTGSGTYVAAVVKSPERAVMPEPKGRTGGL